MILTQPDIYCCKASDGAAVGVGGGGAVPHNITKPQVAAGVAMAIVKLLDKDQEESSV